MALLVNYITVVEHRPIMSVNYSLSVPAFYFWPKLTQRKHGLSAIAELLVEVHEVCMCVCGFSSKNCCYVCGFCADNYDTYNAGLVLDGADIFIHVKVE